MHIHWLQHVPFENLGAIRGWLENKQISLSCTQLFSDDCLPSMSSFDGLIVMGGSMGVYDSDKYVWLEGEKQFIDDCIAVGKPVLGICLGAQLIASALGATVSSGHDKEIGWFAIKKISNSKSHALIDKLPDTATVFHWHGDQFMIPDSAISLYQSEACVTQGFIYQDKVIGLQFHLETEPENAEAIIENCADELMDGKYVQNKMTILGATENYAPMKPILDDILDYLFGA